MEFNQDVLIEKIENDIELTENELNFIKSEVVKEESELLEIYFKYLELHEADGIHPIYDLEGYESSEYVRALEDHTNLLTMNEYFKYDGVGRLEFLTTKDVVQVAKDELDNYKDMWLELYCEI